MLTPTTTDPARLTWERCAGIHPVHLASLCAAFIDVLADTAGIDPDRLVFEPLRCIRTIGDLARFPWAVLYAQLRALAHHPVPRIEEAISHLRLFAELAVIHQRLYLARSGSTLRLLGRCRLPLDLPPELSPIRDDFEQLLGRADRDLQVGRATLAHFQRQVSATRHPLPALGYAILSRARSCYQRYWRAITEAHAMVGRVDWYLAWVEEPGRPLHALSAEPGALSAPAQATMACRPERYPGWKWGAWPPPARRNISASQRFCSPHTCKRGGCTTHMSDAPTELSAFCSICPPASDVTGALAPLGFTLTFFMEEQTFPAYSATPPIPPQYHYRHQTDGTEVIYLAGKDAGDEEERLPPHASRFWIYPGSSPKTMHLVAQLCATKWHLSWKASRSEAIA